MRLTIIGLGNVLLSDDGFGPFVVELLRTHYIFPADVELLDLGTPGLGLMTYLYGSEAAVIVDTVAGGGVPGKVRVYEGVDMEFLPSPPRVSPHDPAVLEALSVARLAGNGPQDICLVGAVPISLELGAGLSPLIRVAADEAAEIVRQRVQDRGFAVQRGEMVQVEQEWWRALRAGR